MTTPATGTLPARVLDFRLPSGTLLLEATIGSPGSADEVTASPALFGQLARVQVSSNQIPDWLEIHAWDLLRNPPLLPTEGAPVPVSADPNPSLVAIVDPEEPQDVFEQVVMVTSTSSERRILGVAPFAREDGSFMPVRGPADTGWQVPREIKLNVADPVIRTDGPATVNPSGLPGQGGLRRFDLLRLFSSTVAHEARHVWQHVQLTETGHPLTNNEVGENRNPDNNDDFLFYNPDGSVVMESPLRPVIDCLPEVARVIRNPVKVVSNLGGSASALIDSPANNEPGLPSPPRGETDSAASLAADADRCTSLGQTAPLLLERDAIRFSRTLDACWTGCPP